MFVFANTSDFIKQWGHQTLNYGLDFQHNIVHSTANAGFNTRYANGGSNMSSASAYGQYKYPISKNSFLSGGIRYTNTTLTAKYNTTQQVALPFSDIAMNNDALTASGGLFWSAKQGWEISLSTSTGFRSPNVDDLTKVFEKSGVLAVPNTNLKPRILTKY